MQGSKCRRVVVSIDHHFSRTQDGVYTDLAFGYENYWKKYLDVFEEVEVFARVNRVSFVPERMVQADGANVRFIDAIDYLGPKSFLVHLPSLLRSARQVSRTEAAFILRNGNLSYLLWLFLFLARRPYGREIQGVVGESVSNWRGGGTGFRGLLQRILASLSERACRLSANRASAVSYVSESLRTRYPNRHPNNEFVFSGVNLDRAAILSPRTVVDFPSGGSRPWELISVGRLEVEKGHHVLIEALARLHSTGEASRIGGCRLTLVGPGSELASLEELAARGGVGPYVTFAGPVTPGPELHRYLDRADVFVLPSLTEGMPRALIEAMARGLPAVATRVGGVPELLPASATCLAGDPDALAQLLSVHLIAEQAASSSSLNFHAVVPKYSSSRMQAVMHEFWSRLESIS